MTSKNAEEELGRWICDYFKKSGHVTDKSQSTHLPVRSKRTISKDETDSTKRVPKIIQRISKERLSHRDYYREWDTFDADKAEKDIDESDYNLKSSVDIEKSENSVKLDLHLFSEVELKFMAMKEKNIGNECFRSKEYKSAITHYSKSISLEEKAVTYGNRANAFMKLSKLSEAMADVNRALAINPAYTKALARRGMIHYASKNFCEAVKDFGVCSSREPGNQEYEKLWNDSKSKLGIHRNAHQLEEGSRSASDAEGDNDKLNPEIIEKANLFSSEGDEIPVNTESPMAEIFTPGAFALPE